MHSRLGTSIFALQVIHGNCRGMMFNVDKKSCQCAVRICSFCLRSLRSLTRCACIQMHRTFRGICALTNTWAAACPTLHSELKERAAPVMGAYTLWGTVWSMASCSTTHGQTVYSCKSHLDVRFASTCPPTCLLSILIIGVF